MRTREALTISLSIPPSDFQDTLLSITEGTSSQRIAASPRIEMTAETHPGNRGLAENVENGGKAR